MNFIEVETTDGKAFIKVSDISLVLSNDRGCVIYTNKAIVDSVEPYEDVVGTLKGLK